MSFLQITKKEELDPELFKKVHVESEKVRQELTKAILDLQVNQMIEFPANEKVTTGLVKTVIKQVKNNKNSGVSEDDKPVTYRLHILQTEEEGKKVVVGFKIGRVS
jgi:hypothetical protein